MTGIDTQKRLESIFLDDPETLGGEWDKWDRDFYGLYSDVPEDLEKEKKRVGVQLYLQSVSGEDPDKTRTFHDTLRSSLASQMGGLGTEDDSKVFEMIQNDLRKRKEQIEIFNEAFYDSTADSVQATLAGEGDKWMRGWVGRTKDTDRQQAGEAYAIGRGAYEDSWRGTRRIVEKYPDLFQAAIDYAKKPNDEEIAARLGEALFSIKPEDEDDIYSTLARMRKRTDIPEGTIATAARLTANALRSSGRGVSDIIDQKRGLINDSALQRVIRGVENNTPLYYDPDVGLLSVQPGPADLSDLPPGTSGFQNLEPVPNDQRAELAETARRLFKINQSLRKAKQYDDGVLNPIEPVYRKGLAAQVEQGLYGAAYSISTLGEAIIPFVGFPSVVHSMIAREYDRVRLTYPDLPYEQAVAQSVVSGAIQGGIERIQGLALLGRMPALKNLVGIATNPASGFFKRIFVAGASENLREGLQDATPILVDALVDAASQDLPGFDWDREVKQWQEQRLATFFAVLPFAGITAGVSRIQDFPRLLAAIDSGSREEMRAVGFNENQITKILAAKDKNQAIAEEMPLRDDSNIAAAAVRADEEIALGETIEQSPLAPKLNPRDDGTWDVISEDGSVANFSNPEDAHQALVRAYSDSSDTDPQNLAVQMAQSMQEEAQDPNRKIVFDELPARVQDQIDRGDVSVEQVAENMAVAGLTGLPGDVAVRGQNIAEIRNGIYTDVSTIAIDGADPWVVHEERAHSQLKKDISEGRLTFEQARNAVATWGEQHPEFAITADLTETQQRVRVEEGMADMSRAFLRGNLDNLGWMPRPVANWIRKMAVFFRDVFKRSLRLKKLIAEGRIEGVIEEHLARSVGLDENVAINQAVSNELGKLTGVSFSLGMRANPNIVAEKLSTMMKSPEERMNVWRKGMNRVLDFIDRFEKHPAKTKHSTSLEAIALLDAATRSLPKEVRGELTGINYAQLIRRPDGFAKTQEILRQLNRLNEKLEIVLKRDAIEAIGTRLRRYKRKNVAGKERSNLTAGIQDFVDLSRKWFTFMQNDKKDDRAAAIDQALAGYEATLNKGFSAKTPEKQQQELVDWHNALENQAAITNFADPKSKKAAQLADSLDILNDKIKEGRARWEKRKASELEQVYAERAVIEELAGGIPNDFDNKFKEAEDESDTIWSKTKGFVIAHYSFKQLIEGTFGKKNQIINFYTRSARKANENFDNRQVKRRQRFRNVFGKVGEIRFGKILQELKKIVPEAIDQIGTQGIPFKRNLSKMEMITLRLNWEQLDVREKMEKSGYTQESYEQARRKTQDQYSQAIYNFLRDDYKQEYADINPVYKTLYGVNLAHPPNYAPTKYHVKNQKGESIDETGAYGSVNGVSAGFLNIRVHHDARMDLQDAMVTYWQHATQVDHWVSYAPLMRRMNQVFGNAMTANTIEIHAGKRVSSKIDHYMQLFADGGRQKANGMAEAEELFSRMMSNVAIATMGFNIRTILRQIDSAFRATLTIPGADLPGAAIRYLAGGNFTKIYKHIRNSETIQTRLKSGFTPALRIAMERRNINPSVLLLMAEKGMAPLQHADAVLTTLSAGLVYDYNLDLAKKQGMSEAEAESFAMDRMSESVFDYSQPVGLANRSFYETSGNVFSRSFFLFQTDPRLKFAIWARALEDIYKGRNQKQAAQHAIVISLFSMLDLFITQAIADVFSDDEDDEIYGEDPIMGGSRYVRAFLLGPTTGMWVVGAGLNDAWKQWVSGEKTWHSDTNFVASALLGTNQVGNAWKEVIDDPSALFNDPEVSYKVFRTTAQALGRATMRFGGAAQASNVMRDMLGLYDTLEEEDE